MKRNELKVLFTGKSKKYLVELLLDLYPEMSRPTDNANDAEIDGWITGVDPEENFDKIRDIEDLKSKVQKYFTNKYIENHRDDPDLAKRLPKPFPLLLRDESNDKRMVKIIEWVGILNGDPSLAQEAQSQKAQTPQSDNNEYASLPDIRKTIFIARIKGIIEVVKKIGITFEGIDALKSMDLGNMEAITGALEKMDRDEVKNILDELEREFDYEVADKYDIDLDSKKLDFSDNKIFDVIIKPFEDQVKEYNRSLALGKILGFPNFNNLSNIVLEDMMSKTDPITELNRLKDNVEKEFLSRYGLKLKEVSEIETKLNYSRKLTFPKSKEFLQIEGILNKIQNKKISEQLLIIKKILSDVREGKVVSEAGLKVVKNTLDKIAKDNPKLGEKISEVNSILNNLQELAPSSGIGFTRDLTDMLQANKIRKLESSIPDAVHQKLEKMGMHADRVLVDKLISDCLKVEPNGPKDNFQISRSGYDDLKDQISRSIVNRVICLEKIQNNIDVLDKASKDNINKKDRGAIALVRKDLTDLKREYEEKRIYDYNFDSLASKALFKAIEEEIKEKMGEVSIFLTEKKEKDKLIGDILKVMPKLADGKSNPSKLDRARYFLGKVVKDKSSTDGVKPGEANKVEKHHVRSELKDLLIKARNLKVGDIRLKDLTMQISKVKQREILDVIDVKIGDLKIAKRFSEGGSSVYLSAFESEYKSLKKQLPKITQQARLDEVELELVKLKEQLSKVVNPSDLEEIKDVLKNLNPKLAESSNPEQGEEGKNRSQKLN